MEFWYEDPVFGVWRPKIYGINPELNASPYPQLATIDGAGLPSEGAVEVIVHDGSAEAIAQEASAVYAGGCWKFWYDDGTSEIVDCYLTTTPSVFSPEVADPVNAANGSCTYTATDLLLAGRGQPLAFARSYDSQQAQDTGPLGYGWHHAYDSQLYYASAGVVCVTYPGGGRVPFTTTNGTVYVAPSGVFETLCKLPDGSYTLTFKSGKVFAYTSGGVLSSITDRYGNQTTLTYSGGRLTQVADSSGRSLSFSYTDGRITLAEARSGGVTQESATFTYSTQGNLVTSTDANGQVTGYGYDSVHRSGFRERVGQQVWTRPWLLDNSPALTICTSWGRGPAVFAGR